MGEMDDRPRTEADEFAADPDACFTEQAAADFLGFSVRTLQGWRYRRPGYGPVHFKGAENRIRYRRKAIVEWIERREKLTEEKRRALKAPRPASRLKKRNRDQTRNRR